MKADFNRAFEILLEHEGGWNNHAADPGGETKFGISKRAHPNVDIPNLTVARAKDIYRTEYWGAARCGELHWPAALSLFDTAVNCGVPQAVRWLQLAAGVTPDGSFGPRTMAAVQAAAPLDIGTDILVRRMLSNARLETWDIFGRGWTRRILLLSRQMLSG